MLHVGELYFHVWCIGKAYIALPKLYSTHFSDQAIVNILCAYTTHFIISYTDLSRGRSGLP